MKDADYQAMFSSMAKQIEELQEQFRIILHNQSEIHKDLHEHNHRINKHEKRIFWCEANIKMNLAPQKESETNGKKARRSKSHQLRNQARLQKIKSTFSMFGLRSI